jgi:O-antigen ligase
VSSPIAGRVSAAGGRLRRPRGAVAFALAAAALELVAGAAVVDARFTLLLVPVAAVGALAFAFSVPLSTLALAVVVTDSIIYDGRWNFSVGGISLAPAEVVVAALLLLAIVRPVRRWWGGAAGGALAAFLALIALATLLAVSAGRVGLFDALEWVRPFVLLAAFYVIVRLVPDRATLLRVLACAAALGAVTGVVSLLVALTSGESSFLQDPSKTIVTSDQGIGSIERVRMPGLALSYILFWFTMTRLGSAAPGRRLVWWGIALGNVIAIAISFNRNMWIGLIIGLGVMLVAGGRQFRGRVVGALAIGAAAIALVVFSGPQSSERSPLTPLAKRATTLLHPRETAGEQSLRDRGAESTLAWRAVKHHLGSGIGAGVPWGTYGVQDLSPTLSVRTPQLYLHNQYLYLIVIGGIPALAALLGFFALVLRDCWRRRGDVVVIACGAGLMMVIVSSWVMISLSVRNWTLAIALACGAIAALAAGPAAVGPPRSLIAAARRRGRP